MCLIKALFVLLRLLWPEKKKKKKYCWAAWIRSTHVQLFVSFFFSGPFCMCFPTLSSVWDRSVYEQTSDEASWKRTEQEYSDDHKERVRLSMLEVCLTSASPQERLWHTVGYWTVCEGINTESFSRIWTLAVCMCVCERVTSARQ